MRFIILLLFLLSLSFGGARVQEYILENGVKLITKETTGKGIVSGVIFIRSGTHGEKRRGLTNLTALLLTKGTKTYSSYQIASTFEDYGGSIYASVSDDYVEIGFSTKVEGLKEGLRVIRSMLLEPLFSEEDLERERRNVLQAIRARREKGQELAVDALRRITYKGSNYEVFPLGLEEDVKAISREDVINRWQEILRSKNVVVSLVGDFKTEQVLPMLREVFSEIPEGEYPLNPVDVPMREDLLERVKRPGSQATVLCAFDAPEFNGREYFAFKVLDAVLGDGMTSKLFKELREKRGYAYAVYSTYPTRLSSPRLIAYIGTSPEKKEDALRDLVEVIKNSKITPEDVELAKNKIVGDFLLARQTRARQAWYLGFFEVMGFGWKMDSEYVDKIRSVSFEEVQALREKYLKIHHCVVVEP
ncbi:MAG: pitrilysin family protein [Aquificaceae bacterium]